MKIDRSKAKRSSTEVPPDCKGLIDKLKACLDCKELCFVLEKVQTWTYGKCELYHWMDVLDTFDSILEEACEKTSEQTWLLRCDTAEFQLKNREKFKCLTLVLRFTTMLIEHSFSRHLYNSMDHLTSLLGSELPELVLDVLNLIYMFSKRSNFLSRLLDGRKEALLERLTYLAESWGGRDAGFGLGACCLDKKNSDYPENATTVHMEFTTASKPDSQPGVATRSKQNELLTIVHIENVDRLEYDTPILMDRICEKYKIPQEKQMLLFTRLRLARHFTTYYRRVILVQLRLQSLSVLVYANAIHDNMHQLVYTGLLEELVELIGFEDHRLDNTKATALRCLTSIIHLDRGQSFPSTVIEITGANSFHGFLPKMVRKCITALLLPPPEDDSGSPKSAYPFHLATALFSFVYHLSSFEPGGEALVSCGMMESLLRVISWKSTEIEHITFVTRAVRVIDLVTNMDMQSFHVQDGLGTFLSRLEVEIAQCRLEEPFEIVPDLSYRQTEASNQNSESAEDITETAEPNQDGGEIVMESDSNSMQDETTRAVPPRDEGSAAKFVASGVTCLPQRAALLKSMFNFLKKVIQDPAFSEGIRHLVETTFPNLLKHIISNAEYYGPSLFMLATDIVTVTVFQEPSVLSTFQDLGLTDVVQEALLVKDIPATREVIASLPNVFSALCLNSRGLNAFVLHKPFPKIFKILISPEYLPAMRRRRTAETFGDTASNLGNAMDELMRHQPSLKVDATSAMVTLLRTLNKMGCDPKYSCWKPQVKPAAPLNNTNNRNGTSEGGSSEEDDDDEEEPSAASHNGPPRAAEDAVDDPIQPTSSYMSSIVSSNEEKAPVPFVDYICNVMKFVDAILSNNSTDDHCREFVNQDGIYPLMEILSAPNLPNDFPNSQACMAVASVCKSILNLAHEGRVLLEGLTYLEVVLEKLEVLNLPAQGVGSSVLLRELAKADIPVESIGNPRDTPILNSITAAHAHIMMFVHVCRTGQSDIRAMSVTNWGSPQGVRVLRLLSKLYLNLVWESTVLLALCTGEYQPGPKEFAREDLDRLIPKEEKTEPTEVSIKGSRVVLPTVQPTNAAASPSDIMDIDNDSNASSSTGGNQDNSVTTLVSSATQTGGGNQKTDKAILSSTTLQSYSKLLKPILSASSRLGRALAELFGLLVKLCVGSPIRQRRGHQLPTVTGFATPGSSAVAKLLAELLTDGLRWEPKPNSPVSRLTFSICTVGFSAPLLFDDKKFAYHLMLRKFTNSGGLKSLFEVFYWALAAEDNPQEIASRTDPIFTDQQVEFLDCWLTLVEKICNPKTVLESPHTYPVKTAIRQLSLFDSGHFLTYAHKLAFHALMHLWNQRSLKAIGPRAADTMLIILGHIIRHRDIEEREAKFQEDKNANPAPSTSAPSTSSSATSAVTSVAPADAPRDLSSTTEQPIAVVRMALELIDRADLSPCNETENAMNSTISQENVESVSLPPAEPSPVDLQQDPLAITNISNAEGEQGTTTEAISEGASHTVALNINPVPLPATDDQHNGNSNEVVPITPDASAPSTSQPDPGTSSVAGAASAALEMGVDYTQVQQLMDMGFPLEMCIEALIATDSVVHATDYLLNNGERVTTSFARTGSAAATPAAAQVPNTRRGPGQGPMDWDYNDEEQMLRAIAMSLGEPTLKISNIVGAKAAAEKQTWKPPETLKAEDIDSFTENILIRSLAIVDQLPECVFRISELLVAIGQRSGADWMGKILNTLVEQIVNSLAMVEKIANEDDKPLNALCVRAESDLLAIRVHLFSLMFEELKTMCAYLLEKWEVIDPAIHLLELLHEAHQNFPGQSKHTPKWLAPLILMIDLYEKSVVATRRRHRLAEETDHIWKWFDINSGKWCAYSTINNNNIDKAFWEGESSLRIMAGRRRYVINFSGMIQLNEETNNRRPIALWLKTVKKEGAKAVEASCKTSSTPANMEVNGEISDLVGGGDASKFATTANIECNFEQLKSDKMDVQDSFTSEEHDDKCISLLRGLNDRQVLSIIRSSVGYMEYPVIPDALHASMRLCLRVTRDHEVAVIFSQFGGVQALVNLKVSSGFHGFLPLANLLIRHVLEDPACLRYAIEKMIRAKAISTSASTCKELHYLLRVLAPVACRSPSLFVEVAKDILRVDINFVTRRGIHAEEDLRLIVKPIPCKPDTFKTYMGKAAQSVIHQLLRALLEPEDEEESSTPNSATGNPLSEAVTETSSDYAHPDLSEATPPTPVEVALPTIDVAEDGLPETLATRPPSSPLKIPKNKENDPPKRLIPKFAIFQLLAESVHSYSYSCKIIAEYCFQGKTHKDIPEDCTALAFLLDRMLPTDQYIGQVNCHGLVKDLLGVMAGCNHLPEAQVIIISEVKAALQRAVNMKESVEKHCRIQCLAYLIAHMVESCSPTIPTQMVTTVKTTQFSMNPVVKLLLKKNVVVDLTRIPLHLDLTSKYLSATTNAVLKALELITRIVNQPAPNNVSRPKPPKAEANQQDSVNITHTGGTSNSEGTHAQGEETVEDADNTEHDISAAAESLDPTSESHAQEQDPTDEGDEGALEEIMDQLLDRESSQRVDDQILSDTLIAESQANRMDIDTGDNPRHNADYEEDHDHDHNDTTTDSGSDHSDDAGEEGEDEDDDDEDEDDDDEDDDDDDGGSNFDDNEQGFMEEGFIRFPALDRDEEMLMVRYGAEPENAPIFFTNNTSYNFNTGLFDDPLINEPSTGLRVTHPLLSAPTAEAPSSSTAANRGHRTGRQRRYQYFQYINPRHPHPPAILQRLLGPSTAQEVITLTAGQGLNPGIRDARLLVMDTTVDAPSGGPINHNMFTGTPNSGNCPFNGYLANYTALHWWCEEAKALDGESMHDCVTSIKREIIETVESDRDQIFKGRREKRAKEVSESRKKDDNVAEVAHRTTHSHGSNLQASVGVGTYDGVPDLVSLSRRLPHHRPIQIVREERRIAEGDQDDSDSSDGSMPALLGLGDTIRINDTRAVLPVAVDSQEALLAPVEISNQESEAVNTNADPVRELPNVTGTDDLTESSDSNQGSIFGAGILDGLVLGNAAPGEEDNRDLMGVLEGLEALTPSPVNAVNALSADRNTNQTEDTPVEPVAGPSGSQVNDDFRNILGDMEVPEGVDPSFLAALPEEMRQEVIAEHLRQQRQRQRTQNPVAEATPVNVMDVSPEFLAALPPNIQEEVLAQQRIEQQRRVAVAGNPNDPVDAEAFFRNLQPSLRQAILADIEESQIAVLPPELVTEAQNLRRELETRNRQLFQDRFFTHSNANPSTTLSSILRNSGMRLNSRYTLQGLATRHGTSWGGGAVWPRPNTALAPHSSAASTKVKGKQLVDHETLSCLLIMLFLDDPKINTGKLHRVLRNLCYHTATRQWVIKSLLSIIERSSECKLLPEPEICMVSPSVPANSLVNKDICVEGLELIKTQPPTWLNIRLDAVLGSQANVFQIQKIQTTGKKGGSDQRHISIHPQAINQICRHVLDVLSNLAKSFPCHFLPNKNKIAPDGLTLVSQKTASSDKLSTPTATPDKSRNASTSSGSGKSKFQQDGPSVEFFDLLLKLDSSTSGRKGKSLAKSHSNPGGTFDLQNPVCTFDESPFGQLISMLNHSFIRRSTVLTDKLLRLLSLISLGIPDSTGYGRKVMLEEPEVQLEESFFISESHLRLIIDVITSKSCSDEGLEEATALLLNLSFGPPSSREKIVKNLMQGLRELGNVICSHIQGLISELQKVNSTIKTESKESTDEAGPSSGNQDQEHTKRTLQGTLMDRFTKETVVVSAGKGKLISCELQLPSMGPLTSKTSSQAFFLRLLKVVISLRDAIRAAIRRHHQKVEAEIAAETAALKAKANSTPSAPTAGPNSTGLAEAAQSMDVDGNESVGAAGSSAPESSNTKVAAETSTGQTSDDQSTEEMKPNIIYVTDIHLLPRLSTALSLKDLWDTLSQCLLELGHTPDHHAVLVLQPAVEAFFLVHSSLVAKDDKKNNMRESREAQLAHIQEDFPPAPPEVEQDTRPWSELTEEEKKKRCTREPIMDWDTLNFLIFAQKHRTVLNQILRQSSTHLADGPFSVLVDHTRVLDFDVKRRYCRTELERLDEGVRREDLAVHVRRSHVFEDSFRELQRRSSEEWKNRFYIVFEGEEGQDAGGLLREWYMIISREIFNPMYALFTVSPGDRVTYMINPSSHCNSNHLFYFKFVGRVIAKAIYDNKLLECYFTRSFYKHILGKYVKHSDMESEDYSFYQGLAFLMDNNVSELGYDLTLSTEVQEFGVTEIRDLVPSGRNIPVTEENKMEYIRLVCQMKMTGAIRKQLNAFLEGFYDIIPKRLISIFNEQELELLVSGLPNVDIEDLKANTEYHKYQQTSLQIQWFWRALRSFDQAGRAKFLQFVTGTSKVPLQGFEALEGMNGVQKFQIHRDDRSTDRLPSAHTCFNQLDLPAYETYDKLRSYLLKAIHECSEGFGFA